MSGAATANVVCTRSCGEDKKRHFSREIKTKFLNNRQQHVVVRQFLFLFTAFASVGTSPPLVAFVLLQKRVSKASRKKIVMTNELATWMS